MKKDTFASLNNIVIKDKFWDNNIRLVREVIIPYQKKAINDEVPDVAPSRAIRNYKIAAGELEGEFFGEVFQDTDVAKWLEAVAYSLATKSDPELEKEADEVIDLIGRAQEPDGYLNTYYSIGRLDQRWTNLTEAHELYTAGHLIEAAVAYYGATGKRKFLDIVCKFADHIDDTFGAEQGKLRGYAGHAEIELALVRLYKATNEKRYLKLAKFFVDERGQEPNYLDREYEETEDKSTFRNPRDWGLKYSQSHLPVREQKTAEGHSVRAMYLYSAMADLALETNDEELADICRTLWENVTQKRMYVTGGIGSQFYGEAFTVDYDLPNDTSYTETCASIGLIFWAQRMLSLEPNGKYTDVLERALFNGALAGMSQDGKRFFYVNPLEVWPEACGERYDKRHVKIERQGWFSCACCPPNLARLLASLGGYIYSQKDNEVFVHLYVGGTADLELSNQTVQFVQETNYPWDGKVKITVNPANPEDLTLNLRIPGWCQDPTLAVNGEKVDLGRITDKGYAKVRKTWTTGDLIELEFPMPVQRIYAHPEVRVNAGKIALMRGPIVYCLEEADNGSALPDVSLPRDSKLEAQFEAELMGGIVTIVGEGNRTATGDKSLYRTTPPSKKAINIKAIPYYAWNNRGNGEMLVWIREE